MRRQVLDAKGALCGIVTADDVQRVVSAEMASLANALKRSAEREVMERRILDVLGARG